MAQYPLPQFIEAEGKIIYFLTFRQFFLLILAGGICFILYFTLPFTFFVITGLLTLGIILGIAFLKIDNTSILTFFFNFINYSAKAKNFTWRKKPSAYPIKLRQPSKTRVVAPPPQPSAPSAPLKTGASSLSAAKKIIDTKK